MQSRVSNEITNDYGFHTVFSSYYNIQNITIKNVHEKSLIILFHWLLFSYFVRFFYKSSVDTFSQISIVQN